jgi:SAM-dependent methyltransferase
MSSSHFDHIAHVYDHSLPGHVVEHYLEKRARFVIDHCPRGDGLDVGCGTGVLASRLAAAGYRMSGVDPSDGMLAILRERAPEVDAVPASGSQLPYEDDSFDLVLCVAVLHHVGDPAEVRRTLEEMVRVSRPGGRVLVWDHNPRNPYWGPLMAKVPQDTGDERLIPEQEVIGGLAAGGARILMSAQLGFVPDFTPRALLSAAALLERAAERTPLMRRFAAHNVVLATKPAQRGA